MACEFFFSYTRVDNDAYLKQFFEELCAEIRVKRGLPKSADVAFFDQQDLELGVQWDDQLVEALQTARVFVAVGSPGYFRSPYCGKEWSLFRERCRVANPAAPPPLIKPVVWVPFRIDTLPAEVRAGQLLMGDPQAVHNQRGLRYMLKQIAEHRAAYVDLIDRLADQIIGAADQHAAPPLPKRPRLADVPPAFGDGVQTGGVPAGAVAAPRVELPPPSGPKHVFFVYVAADPAEFGAARPPEPYADSGGSDWKPYYPVDPTRVHLRLQNIASSEGLDFTSEELRFGDDLIERIDRAWQQRQIVVLVVDAWSLHWDRQRAAPRYGPLLRQLDGRFDVHWCVLVPENPHDPVVAGEREAVTASVRSVFDRHAVLAPNPLYYREGIRTVDELKHTVTDVLTRLRAEITKRAEVARPVPAGPARQVVSAAGV